MCVDDEPERQIHLSVSMEAGTWQPLAEASITTLSYWSGDSVMERNITRLKSRIVHWCILAISLPSLFPLKICKLLVGREHVLFGFLFPSVLFRIAPPTQYFIVVKYKNHTVHHFKCAFIMSCNHRHHLHPYFPSCKADTPCP